MLTDPIAAAIAQLQAAWSALSITEQRAQFASYRRPR
jgi:hypothetical protein